MLIQRLFSLESGSYNGGKRTPSKSDSGLVGGAVVGGLIGAALGGIMAVTERAKAAMIMGLAGAGFGLVTKWLSNITDQSEFNRGRSGGYNSFSFLDWLDFYFNPGEQESETTTSSSSSETDETGRTVSRTVTRKTVARPKREAEGVRYAVDGDPKKYIVSILFSGHSAGMYINNANPRELQLIDRILDIYCYSFRNADYISEKIGKGSYFVDVKLIDGEEYQIGKLLIDNGIKLNILTGNRFGIKGR